jgi:hypothetical protein
MPTFEINPACELDGLEHLIEQYRPGQHRKCGEVPGKGRVFCRNADCALHLHVDSMARS